jgi:hypothetical protein
MPKKDYRQYLIKKPLREAGPKYEMKNRMNPSMTYLSDVLLPGAKQYIEFGWVWGMPEPNPHTPEHMHKNDEIILHIGSDYENPEDLGAEIENCVGGQPIIFNTTSGLFVPKWLRHGPVTWKKYRRPHLQMTITLGTGNLREGWVDMNGEEAKKHIAAEKKGTDYSKYMTRKPTYEVVPEFEVAGRRPALTLMSNNLVPGSNIYIETGWVFGMPDPNPHIHEHTHDYDEIVVHFGTDYQHPEELGGEIEFMMAGQPLTIDCTSIIFVPKGVKHGPLTWKKYSRPHLELTIMIGAGSLAQADPGGHQKRKEQK